MNEVMDAQQHAPGQEAPQSVSRERLWAAFARARDDLLAERETRGHWVGELSTSALSTATAISALAVVERRDATTPTGHFVSEARESFLSELIVDGIHWLAEHQNPDGGWGDTDKSHSNIATTMLAVAAFNLTGVPVKYAGILERAQKYIEQASGIRGLKKRYGRDKTFAVPILTNCALAGMVPWRKVSPLPFELACLPQHWYRFLRLPVVSYAIPALVAIGQARFHHAKPRNPLVRYWRGRSVEPSLEILRKMQPASGGYLEAIPLTSFVVMSLASIGRVNHPVTQAGLEFIVESVREDGSWPIDTDLATWNTTLAINALAGAGEDIWQPDCLKWLLNCQQQETHPYTGAEAGGWGWSDLSGAVPDADDTPGALIALAHFRDSPRCDAANRQRIVMAAQRGLTWLLNLQNSDGGWPTFCRGWGKLPFDRSGADLTAHALRALLAWRDEVEPGRWMQATTAALRYLVAQQRPDGAWVPLWFGNQDEPREENPVYGTAKVVIALCELCKSQMNIAGGWQLALNRGVQWLALRAGSGQLNGIEETSVSVEALLAAREVGVTLDAAMASTATLAAQPSNDGRRIEEAIHRPLAWLVDRVEQNRHRECSPIGFYFAKLWYYEKLYPLTFTASALGRAVQTFVPPTLRKAAAHPA